MARQTSKRSGEAGDQKPAKLALDARLCREVERGLLFEVVSRKQIAARLRSDYPDDLEMRVSPETIYRSLFIQARGALRKELAVIFGRDARSAVRTCAPSGPARAGSGT